MILILILFSLIYCATLSVYKSLLAAGVEKNKALIPFVNTMEFVRVLGRPKYQAFVVYLPIFNFFLIFSFFTDLSRCFGRTSFTDYLKAMLIPIVHFSQIPKTNKYLGTITSLSKEVKSTPREWADSILFAVLAATLIRWSTFEAFTIPTSSMEGTLMVGDYLFVSKLHYGPRAPITPLQIPLTHQTIWFTDKKGDGTSGLKSYSDIIQLPYFRFPGLTDIKRNDIVVFNWPWDNGKDTYVNFDYLGRADLRPTDLKTNYVKRCVAVAGDTLQIKNQVVYINGKVSNIDGVIQHSHKITFKPGFIKKYIHSIDDIKYFGNKLCDDFGIRIETRQDPNTNEPKREVELVAENAFVVNTSEAKAEELRKLNYVDSVEKLYYPLGSTGSSLYPAEKAFSFDEYGPIVMPKKGMTIPVTKENLIMFDRALTYFEDENIEMRDNQTKLFVNGKEVKEYTFKKNYYYMVGDNRHGSYDSRTWAFVPEDHIVGTPLLVWMSIEDTPNKGLFSRIRWERLFKWVR